VTRQVRILVGALTVVMATGFGITFLLDQRWWVGGVLVGLAVLRAILLVRDVRATAEP
jgi:hypothetical protein